MCPFTYQIVENQYDDSLGYGNSSHIYAKGPRNFNAEFQEGILKDSEVVEHVRSVIGQNLPYKPKFTKVVRLPQGLQAIMQGGQHKILGKLIKRVTQAGGRDRLVREVGRAIVHAYKVPSKDFVNEAGAIQNFIQRQMRYVFDMGEQFEYPHRSLIDWYKGKAGLDCDCQAILFASLMVSLGWRAVWVVLVDSRGNGVLSHACAAIKMPRPNTKFGGKLVNVEMTKPVPLGWLPDTVKYTKYLMIDVVKGI